MMTANLLAALASANPMVAANLRLLHARALKDGGQPLDKEFAGSGGPKATGGLALPAAGAPTYRYRARVGQGRSRKMAWPQFLIAVSVVLAMCAIFVTASKPELRLPRVGPPINPELGPSVIVEIGIVLGIIAMFVLALAIGVLLIKVLRHMFVVAMEPLGTVRPPDAHSSAPLSELDRLAGRSVQRLHVAYKLQIGLSMAVAIVIGAAFVWSLIMITFDKIKYATVLGTGGIGATAFAAKWQPVDRVGRARDLAEQADVLATGLRLRMSTIGQIGDPVARQLAEWTAVKEYTAEALGMRAVDREPQGKKAQPPRLLSGQDHEAASSGQ